MRGYFWNPTDLVNVDKRIFLDLDRGREGVYGLRVHVPFCPRFNIYGFLDMGAADNFGTTAFAGKVNL